MKKEKVVIYIITKLELGGAQKVCLSLFEGIQEKNENNIDTFLISGINGTLAEKVKNKKNVILLKNLEREVSPFSFYKEIVCFFQLIKAIRKIKKQYKTTILHTHSTKAGLLGRWAALLAGVKKRMHTVHGFGFHPHQNKIAWLINYLCELITSLITTKYVCVSSFDIKIGKKLLPGFANKHSLIRAAVDDKQFYIPARKTKLPDKPFIFGTVACFKPQKNLFDLLKAFEIVQKSNNDTRLEIIGDGLQRNAIETWIKERKLEKNIILHGWQNEVAAIMSSWHAFVLTSLWEGLPCSVVEARMLGLPVVSYNVGGISDVIKNGKNGFLIEPGNWQQIALAMKLVHKKNLQLIKQETLPEFSRKMMVRQHRQLY